MRDANLTPTGRELKDPAATLVECVDPEGLKHTVIAFDEPYRGHPALTTGVELILSFMAYPMVTGLVECSFADVARARFAYPTGTVWTVKELTRSFEQVGQTIGARAALELCYLAGMVLHEAGETGPLQGCFSHGNLNPWRIGMKADGQLQVFGYGLAQVEMDLFLKGQSPHIDLDSVRYAPPERLEQQPEQPSSDFYSLALVAFEMMTGKPLYDETDSQRMVESVKLAEGVSRITGAKLPRPIQDVFGSALVYDPDRRLQGQEFVEAVGNLLDDARIEGRTLAEVMQRLANQSEGRSKRKLVKASGTAAFTPESLAALAADAEEEDQEDDSKAPRWASLRSGEATTGRARRARQQPAPAEPAPRRTRNAPEPAAKPAPAEPAAPAPPPTPPAPRTSPVTSPVDEGRRRRRTAEAPAEPTPPPVSPTPPPPPPGLGPTVAPEDDGEDGGVRRRRRRRTMSTEVDEAAEAAPVEPEAPRRRRRRIDPDGPNATDAAQDDDDEAHDDAEPAAEGEVPRRRRRRRPPEGEEDTPEAPEAPEAQDEQPDEADEEDPTATIEAPRRRRRRRGPDDA
ncbi:MAG: hypothetical protein H6736_16760 [Alphaproteobacteria bacterium]|nr:hypothetical protein [Alphaproteobacteria bacterium]